jgi:hypothetical protein
VFESAGDLGLEEEPLAADRVVGMMVEDLLEGHFAMQLAVERHEDGPQTAAGMWPKHAEPLAVAGGRADGVGRRAVILVILRRAVSRGDMAERRVDLRVAHLGQAFTSGAAGRDRGQALLGVAAMFLNMQGHHRLDGGTAIGVRAAPVGQVIGQRPGLVAGPRPGTRRRAALDR